MLTITISPEAEQQLDIIHENKGIYNGRNFTQQFINWNSVFHRYVNSKAINQVCLQEYGWYNIGDIGLCEYQCVRAQNGVVFNIIEFRFSKLPYQQQQQQYEVIGDAGYGYEIIQSAFNHKYSILTPQRKYLTKFVFDEIIGFHHSSSDFNTIYAIGFQENRVFAIYQDGIIEVLPYSKEEYLNKKHKYYESHKTRKMVINESHIRQIIRETLRRYLQL